MDENGNGGVSERLVGEKSFLSLASAFSNKSPQAPAKWTDGEVETFLGLMKGALRLKSMELLKSAIHAFGGVAPRGGANRIAHPLYEAAEAADAFGFGLLLDECVLAATGEVGFYGRPIELSDWLRSGMPHPYKTSERVSSDCSPVMACFSSDNPLALAEILSRPQLFEALVKAEPEIGEGPPSDLVDQWRKEAYKGSENLSNWARYGNHGFENSLLYVAVSLGAFRCAALLASIPDFGAASMTPNGLWFENKDSNGRRRAQSLFKEEGVISFDFFEQALASKALVERMGGSRSEHLECWGMMIDAMIDAAPEAAKTYCQEGTGLGWVEMYFAHEDIPRIEAFELRSRSEKSSIPKVIERLDRFRRANFRAQWELLAGCCSPAGSLQSWIELSGAVSEPAPKADRRRSSL